MNTVKIDNIKEDMILAADIRDINGRLLLLKDQKIKANHIRIFKMWGISEVSVVGDNGDEGALEVPIDPLLVERTLENTRSCFKHTDLSHPAMGELFKLSTNYRCKNNIFVEQGKSGLTPVATSSGPAAAVAQIRRQIAKKRIKLPEIPSIVFELNEVIANPYASAETIARVVEKSPSLTALLLRIVNSAFYGFPSRIGSISRAVMIIGTKEIADLAIGISTITLFKNIPKEIMDMSSFLLHSFACGIISRIVGARLNLANTEQLFVAGLLHDIGKLILYQYFPGHAAVILNKARENGSFFHQEETKHLGFRHTDMGADLLRRWKLPHDMEKAVLYHHRPSAAPSASITAAIVHLADVMANGLGIGSSGERFVPSLDTMAWSPLGLTPNSFEGIVNQASHQLGAFQAFITR